ncbi:hypothetical protein [Streptomyces sp. NPDC018693]|uniref:hypothetical protein n=1 Tax=unclassified Streptomyces TaxID=2593676 RepID=UPI0037973AE2
MRRGLVVVTVLAAVTTGACTDDGREGMVVQGTPPATPYSGRLDIPAREQDEYSQEAIRQASGAAGRALECDTGIFHGNGPDGWNESDGGDTPEDGLALYFDLFTPQVPRQGYRVERREADRVLYSYDVGGRTKVAVVVAKDQRDRPGWGPETSASCDPAELPEGVGDDEWYEIWTDSDGRRLPVAEIHTSTGPEHCNWQSARFLDLGRHPDRRTYVRDPHGVLARDMLTTPYDGDARLPADARDTGYRHQDWQLWLTDDPTTAYVRTPDGVEAWPALREDVACY